MVYLQVFDPHFEVKVWGERMLGNQLKVNNWSGPRCGLFTCVDSLGSLFLIGLFRQV